MRPFRVFAPVVAAVLTGVLVAGCGASTSTTSSSSTGVTSSSTENTVSTVSTESTESSASAALTSEAESAGSTSSSAGDCATASLPTFTPGTLTIATSEPAYEPWIVDNDPTSGKGYESAVAYAVAEQLGFTKDQVTWVRVPFDAAIAPTPKDFDFDINQVSISDERSQAVDFSTGYYDVAQAVVTVKGSPIEAATTLAALKDAKLGAMLGTTSLDAITASIAPATQPAVFDDNALGVAALQNGTIDGLVLDLPSAFYAAGAQLTDGLVLGQLPPTSSDTEQFGLVLDKGSPLTSCVSDAVDAVRAAGTFDALVDEWISNTGTPKLS